MFLPGNPVFLRYFLDAFVLTTVAYLIAFHILPHSVEVGGWPALLAGGLGLIFPLVFDRLLKKEQQAQGPHQLLIFSALSALLLHVFLDGGTLAIPHQHAEQPYEHAHQMLTIAVILHRLPVGFGIWWVVRPRYGVGRALLLLLLVSLATILGYSLALYLGLWQAGRFTAIFQAFVLGSLFHILYLHLPGSRFRENLRATVSGVALALVLVVLLVLTSPAG